MSETREIRPMVLYHVYCQVRRRGGRVLQNLSVTVETPQIRSHADYERMVECLKHHWGMEAYKRLLVVSLSILYVHRGEWDQKTRVSSAPIQGESHDSHL